MLNKYYVPVSWLTALVLAQFLKPFFIRYRTGILDFKHVFDSGGFPSSHSSSITALTIAIGIKEGFDSSIFYLALGIASIVMFDAANVRYEAGRNNKRVTDLIFELISKGFVGKDQFETDLKEVLGHTWSEVFSGFILGIIISIVFKFLLKV